MAKRKKHKDEVPILYRIDNSLDKKYENVLKEIEVMKAEIDKADRKGKKLAKKKLKKNNDFYQFSYEIKKRKEVVEKMERKNLFDKIEEAIQGIRPICVLIARLVAALIVAILSIDVIKKYISPKTVKKLSSLYNLAMQV